MTEHIRQIGDTCTLAATAMACGCTQLEYENDLLPLWGNKSASFADMAPVLMTYGRVMGSVPTFGVNIIEEQIGKDTALVEVDRHIYGSIVRLAEEKT